MKNSTIGILVSILLVVSGCGGTKSDVVIVSKTLKKEVSVSTAVPGEFGDFSPASSNIFWVEGMVKNDSKEDLKNVELGFKCTDGTKTVLFSVDIPSIPAGKTIPYKTRIMESRVELRLLDEDPDIRVR